MTNFSVAEAQIVALFMECIVYGIYLVTLWITARALFFDAAGDRKKANWPMVAVMALMAVFATLDVSLGLKHNLDAFIFSSGPSGPQPEQEFRNISYWVNVMKTVDTQVMTLIGDAMLIYRAFIVFSHSLLVVILPVVLWLAATACSVAIIWITATLNQNTVISSTGLLKPFLYAFFCITIVLNLLTTAIIIQKIWRTNKKSAPYITHASQSRSSRPPRTKLENVIRIILESGMLYTITVLITFICELAGSNAIYGVSDVMVITVGISFNLIIIRVDRAASSSEVSATPSNAHDSIGGFPLRFLRSSMTHERSQRNVEITITRDVAFDGDLDSDDKTGRTDADADTDVEGKPETGWAVAV